MFNGVEIVFIWTGWNRFRSACIHVYSHNFYEVKRSILNLFHTGPMMPSLLLLLNSGSGYSYLGSVAGTATNWIYYMLLCIQGQRTATVSGIFTDKILSMQFIIRAMPLSKVLFRIQMARGMKKLSIIILTLVKIHCKMHATATVAILALVHWDLAGITRRWISYMWPCLKSQKVLSKLLSLALACSLIKHCQCNS
jgi:hypothetical protein